MAQGRQERRVEGISDIHRRSGGFRHFKGEFARHKRHAERCAHVVGQTVMEGAEGARQVLAGAVKGEQNMSCCVRDTSLNSRWRNWLQPIPPGCQRGGRRRCQRENCPRSSVVILASRFNWVG